MAEPESVPYKVVCKVIRQEGSCGFGHKVGDEILFNGRTVEGEICFSALYSMIPKIFAMMYGAHFPWLDDKDAATHACPDAHNPVTFEVRRVRESL